ncbi:CidA/LrgA family protein [Ramlibacter tataouinensis]|uniref:CidA/LrgA family protein n=1 Tax=Ramlibacter tataouinensis TaxID=94132 RepID=UPI0022F3B2F1|nr:CidA/LrgA family protein [Ramlibacter tataouinensis]WBY02659.1 CidA/LrgA family protein [Ramlibacter tataouinensis]
MTSAIAALVGLYLLGEGVVRSLGLPVPGALVGMLLMFAALALLGRVPAALGRVGGSLLRHMVLLLIPSLAGVMVHVESVRSEGWAFLLACVAGAALTLAVTAATLNWMLRRTGGKRP